MRRPFHGLNGSSKQVAPWATAITCVLFAASLGMALRAEAGPIPLPEAWTYDGPQPHGQGGVVVDHQPHGFGGLASDTAFLDVPNSQLVADDFVLPSDSVIRRIRYWGFYGEGVEPLQPEAFRISVHESRLTGGLPGDTIQSQLFSSATRAWTGNLIPVSGAPREFLYEVELPESLSLFGGTLYWLEIAQFGDIDSRFRWEFSINTPFTGLAFNNSLVNNWTLTTLSPNGNAAFQLDTVPEPSSIGILGLSIPLLIGRDYAGRARC